MTYTQLRNEMRYCRCVYKGLTNPMTAYQKNYERICKSYRVKDYDYQVWLNKYNAELYGKKMEMR